MRDLRADVSLELGVQNLAFVLDVDDIPCYRLMDIPSLVVEMK